MSLKGLTIRRANETDLDTMVSFNQALFQHDGPFDGELDFSFPDSEGGRKYFFARIHGEDSLALIASIDGEPVGYLVAAETAGESYRYVARSAELENMLVGENVRGKGVGAKLVDEFIKWCKARSILRVKVSAYAANAEALRFYEKQGFKNLSISLEMKI